MRQRVAAILAAGQKINSRKGFPISSQEEIGNPSTVIEWNDTLLGNAAKRLASVEEILRGNKRRNIPVLYVIVCFFIQNDLKQTLTFLPYG